MTAATAREVARGSGVVTGLEVVNSEAEGGWEVADWGAAAGLVAAAANESGGRGAKRLGRSMFSVLRSLGLASPLLPAVSRAAHRYQRRAAASEAR